MGTILDPRAILAGGLLLTGCAGGGNLASDPLFGGPPGRSTGPSASRPAQTAALPPLPSPTSATSPAALASGSVPPLDGSHGLRIPSPPAALTGTGGMAGVTLSQPQPANDLPARQDSFVGRGAAMMSGLKIASYEQAQSLLLSRGVIWQRLETWGDAGEWKFSCSIPNRQNPNIRRLYEAKAHDPIAALRATIDQMDQEQR